MKRTILSALLLTIVCVPQFVQAETVIRSGNTVTVEADQQLEGDFYGFGRDVSISGPAKEDVYVAGMAVTLNAPIDGDLVVTGGNVQVHGAVKDDVRIIGGDVVIAEPVGGDVVVLGGTLTILSTASVGGDVLFMGGAVNVNGVVKGSVVGMGEDVRIDSQVVGNVRVQTARELTLGNRADVGGYVRYTSPQELNRAQNAVVAGAVQREKVTAPAASESFRFMALVILTVLFTALTAFLLARPLLVRVADQAATRYGMHGLIGFAVVLTTPLLAIILLASVIGFVVGMALLISYLPLLLLAWIVAGIMFGTYLQRSLLKKQEISLLTVIFGTIFFNTLVVVPFIGPVVMVACFFIALGAMVTTVYQRVR